MSNRSRWQPPHSDPARVSNTPVSDRRIDRAKPGYIGPCIWPGCHGRQDPFFYVMLCTEHAHHVRRKMNHYDMEQGYLREVAHQESEAQRVLVFEETKAKIDAGVRVSAADVVPGWVYYIQIDDTIKIGYASHVASRMRAYPPSARLLAVEPGTKLVEKRRHQHFGQFLAHGREWFRDVPELREWITTLVAEYGDPADKAYTYTTPTDGTSRTPVVVGGKRAKRRW